MKRKLASNPALWVAIGVPVIGMLMTAITVFAALASSSPGSDLVESDQKALSKTSWRSDE